MPVRERHKPVGVGVRVQRAQRRIVESMSDRWLERIVGSRLGMRLLFAAMERMYRPDRAGGFRGEIEFELTTPRGANKWTVTCGEDSAISRPGASGEPALRVRGRLADFLRVGTGELDGPAAVLGGKLGVQGDFGLAMRLSEMFGG